MKRSKLLSELLPYVGHEIWLSINYDSKFAPIDVRIWVLDALKLVHYFPISFTYSYTIITPID